MNEKQYKKLIEYVNELVRQHDELESKVKTLERRIAELKSE